MNQVARRIDECLASASWIRRMFEEADRLRRLHGAANVFDFSLGNPHLEPPLAVADRLRQLANDPPRGLHRYMPNGGFVETRSAIADVVGRIHRQPLSAEHVVMTAGAASGLNVTLRALLDPDDEVIVFAPLFAEYPFYIMHAGGRTRVVETDDRFQLVGASIEAAIHAKTRAVILNSPNNPTGRVYPDESIAELIAALERVNRQRERPIILIADEPYRGLVFDGVRVPTLLDKYPNSVIVGSFSKDLGLAGERIGYIATHPRLEDGPHIVGAMIFCLRTLGFVNAPALMQRTIETTLGSSVEIDRYRRNRDLLWNGLIAAGYSCEKPEGAFFLFPKTPIADDVEFARALAEERVLTVPGIGFGRSGHLRLSYAVDENVIDAALPAFARVFAQFS